MKCVDCKHFKIAYDPCGYEWGRAKCERYNLYVDFSSRHKLNRLTHEQGREVAKSSVRMGANEWKECCGMTDRKLLERIKMGEGLPPIPLEDDECDWIEDIDFIADHPKKDMSKVDCIRVNGKEYLAADKVMAIIDKHTKMEYAVNGLTFFRIITTVPQMRKELVALKGGE